ncbi:YveK family protein [Enterococcus alcedinis]|uniref:Capsular polysaccharide biosynthesis protein CpsC n=1 Tax=Enterococcus alcedinis TaxID=1274384 RepID=A0A917JH11_9ENTE|nr:Wzz/FepE/Etk N-terminal domain-containing protein [Enterococcus alcedinis]MBP2102108.1 capsular polysaccharide biosynthesis protein [Enterococcus alcedinis]GGI65670.1 tyrosine protein kinase [Enterococcus alcedinis]
MEETISLKEIFDIVRKRITTIMIATFVGLGIAGVFTFFIVSPQYSSRAQLIVSLPQSETTSVNDINFNLQMLNTYKDIILQGDGQATEVQNRLAEEYQINMTPSEIKAALQVVQAQNSQLFSIQATSGNASDAAAIANVTAEVFQETVKDILTNVDTVTIVSSAVASTSPVSPNNFLNLAIGLFLGMMIGLGLAFLFELLDRTVKDPKFVTDTLGLTILGTVPLMTAKEASALLPKKKNPIITKPSKPATETPRRRRSKV